MNKKRLALFVLCTCCMSLKAQQGITLLSYIDSVLQKNPAILHSENDLQKTRLDKRQSIWNFTPEVSAQLNVNKIYGTAFDNVTFQRIQKATTNVFPSLNLNITLFDGFVNVLRARYAQFNQNYAEYQSDIKRTEQVTQAVRLYCQYLVDQQNTILFESRKNALDKLLQQKKIEAERGSISQAALLAVVAQTETEIANYLDAKTREHASLRQLYAFIQQKADTSKKISATLPEPAELQSGIKNLGLHYLELRSKKRREEQLMSANMRWQSLSSFSPKVYLSSSLASSYSSNGIIDYNTGTISYPNYGTQFRLNQYQFIGFTLSVPLFSKMSRVINYQKTTIDRKDIALKNAEEDLADQNMLAGLDEGVRTLAQRHQLLSTSAEASAIAFREQEMKFKEGHIDFYTYMNAMNTRDAARLELLRNQVEHLVNAVQLAFWDR